MKLDIPLFRTSKGQKTMSLFATQDLEYVKIKNKSSYNYSFFHRYFENRNS